MNTWYKVWLSVSRNKIFDDGDNVDNNDYFVLMGYALNMEAINFFLANVIPYIKYIPMFVNICMLF